MIFAVDGGGTTFKTCLVDDEGNLSNEESFPLEVERGIPALRDSLNAIFQRRKKESDEREKPIRAIGVGCRGIIDMKTKKLVTDSGIMNFFSDHSFRELIDTDLPLGAANDAVAATMGENKYGAGKRVKSLILFTLGTGIGGGFTVGGKVHIGASGMSEMGHYPVNPEGDLCGCGNTGCIEREFSAHAFDDRIKEVNVSRGPQDQIKGVKDLFARAEQGEQECLKIIRRGVFYLARGISGYANAIDPDKFVLSGGLAKAGDFLMNMLIEELKPILWMKDPAQFVEYSKLGAKMGLYGAGAVGAEELEIHG